jgi:hypothetical protein
LGVGELCRLTPARWADKQFQMKAEDKKALDDIEKFGCHILHVMEEGDEPPFSYSIGVQKSTGAPEAVVIGLKQPIAHHVLNEYNSRVRNGERFANGKEYSGFIEGFPVQFELVAPQHYDEYFGWTKWLYGGTAFSVLQIVFPTTEGVWPWDSRASEWFRKRQPILSDAASDMNTSLANE